MYVRRLAGSAAGPSRHPCGCGLNGTPIPVRTAPATLPMVVWGHGASAAASREANRLMIEVLGSLGPANLGLLDGIDVQLHIIPHDRKLTDLVEFGPLKGQKTVDGRNYEDLRGMGGTKFGGSILYAAGEETLVTIPGHPSLYFNGYVASHESGHVVEQFALTKAQKKALQQAYDTRVNAIGPWLSAYASSNVQEYFASSTAAFFGHPRTSRAADRSVFTRGWLKENDRPMYRLLAEVYKRAPS